MFSSSFIASCNKVIVPGPPIRPSARVATARTGGGWFRAIADASASTDPGAPMAPSALAARLGMTRGAISKIVDRLEGKGLAVRTSNTVDRRAQTIALTRTGRARVPKLAALADKNDAEFFGYMSVGERAQLVAVMQEIVRRGGLRTVPTE